MSNVLDLPYFFGIPSLTAAQHCWFSTTFETFSKLFRFPTRSLRNFLYSYIFSATTTNGILIEKALTCSIRFLFSFSNRLCLTTHGYLRGRRCGVRGGDLQNFFPWPCHGSILIMPWISNITCFLFFFYFFFGLLIMTFFACFQEH